MIAQLIDLSNYNIALVQSSQSRSGTPDGNIFFDVANGRIELITAQELANVDLHGGITGAQQQIDVVASAGTYTRTSGDFVTEGFKAGLSIAFSGFTNGGNNVTKVIQSVTATVITVTDNTGLVDETGSGDEQGDSVAEANPLDDVLGVRKEGLYAFENQERRIDENLRKYDRYFRGTFKFGGAYELINGRKFDDADGTATSNTTDDRNKVRNSGWIERDASGNIGRIFYGVTSLGNIEATSQPYYQLLEGGAPTDYSKQGDITEAIQVYGDNNIDANAYDTSVVNAAVQIDVVASARTFTRSSGDFIVDGFAIGDRFDGSAFANSANNATFTIESVTATVITVTQTTMVDETGSGDEVLTVTGFDRRTYKSSKVRTFGFNYDEKILADSGVSQMDGYASGFALGETPHLTTGNYTLADVYGGGQIAPWTGMTLEKLAVPQTESGFNEADGDFTWVLNNTGNGTLYECVAFLDALAQTDDDIDSGGLTVTRGKREGTWYSYDAQGRIVTNAPFDGEGLFIENVPTADEQLIVFTADDGNTKTRPFQVEVKANVGSIAVSDALAWYHTYFLAAYNTAGAITVQDATATDVKGNVSTDHVSNEIVFPFDYDGDTLGGTAGTDKDCVFICEGDGGATQAKTLYTIIRQTTVTFSCAPAQENNV